MQTEALSNEVQRWAIPASDTVMASQQARPALSAVSEMLECIPDAAALVDASGKSLLVNRPAEDILLRGAGIARALDGRLIVIHPNGREAFHQALAECARTADSEAHSAISTQLCVSIPRFNAQPLLLRLRQLQTRYAGAVAILFITDPETWQKADSLSLQNAYGLSPAEARLVQALANGLSLKQIAQRSDLSYETVRSYVKRALTKTGTRRQVDLIRLAGSLR